MPFIRAIGVYLPDRLETNDDLMREHPDWMMDKVAEKPASMQNFSAE